jgi:Integrase core domain
VDFHDDATRYTHIEFLKTKDQAFDAYKTLNKALKTQFGMRIKILRTDRGGEFLRGKFDEYLKSRGTRWELIVHDTHEQVRVAERYNRYKLELTRSLQIDAGLPEFLWAKAIRHATWIKNCLPHAHSNSSRHMKLCTNVCPI